MSAVMKFKAFCLVLGLLLFSTLLAAAEDKDFAAYDQALSLRQRMSDLVYRAEVKPNWLADDRCWYRVQTGPQTHEFVLVNPDAGGRRGCIDEANSGEHRRLDPRSEIDGIEIERGMHDFRVIRWPVRIAGFAAVDIAVGVSAGWNADQYRRDFFRP